MSVADMLDDDDWIETVPASLVSRIQYQRGRPDLNLGVCSIDKVPLEVIRNYYGKLSSISSLCLEYNQIRTLPSTFVFELKYIQVLDLGNNQLERLPEDFGKLEQLVYLDIHKNKLQSLPLSMGKMKRLTYLSLADNPFGPPICDFLELEKHRLNGDTIVAHIAQLVVNFLAKIPPHRLTIDSGSGDQPFRRRAVTFENVRDRTQDTTKIELQISPPIMTTESEDNSTESVKTTQSQESVETDLILGPFMSTSKSIHPNCSVRRRRQRQRQRAQVVLVSTEESWSRHKINGAALLLVWLAMCPVMMALVFETSAVDQFVKEHNFLASIWKTYRPIHETTENGINFIQLDNAIKVRGPRPEDFKEYQDVNLFTALFLSFRKALMELFQNIVEFGQ